jgi:phosphopantothenoylcysteine decarboxylase/phosphopantothenate--cysteine ligase
MNILITAGPTREPIDPVRYLSNRSSGKMGYALAKAAVEAGHRVTLISGPVALEAALAIRLINVETTQQMFDAVREHIATMDAAIFAAAVADYRPVVVAHQKLKKSNYELVLRLERTPDILGSARSVFGFKGMLIGFAAETEKLVEHATEKLQRKGCNLIVANDVSDNRIGFDSDENAVTLLRANGTSRVIGRASKTDIATEIIREIGPSQGTATGLSRSQFHLRSK